LKIQDIFSRKLPSISENDSINGKLSSKISVDKAPGKHHSDDIFLLKEGYLHHLCKVKVSFEGVKVFRVTVFQISSKREGEKEKNVQLHLMDLCNIEKC
jgi:hypothetical protein